MAGQVQVDGAVITNPRALARTDASTKLRSLGKLRGALKLSAAIAELGLNLVGKVAVDIGAAAGGFTQALLDAGCVRVYAVDAGYGQLRGTYVPSAGWSHSRGPTLGSSTRSLFQTSSMW